MRRTTALTVAIGWCLVTSFVNAQDKFEKVRVYFEQTVQDNDAEVKFEATGGATGLATLKVVAPDGRTVVDFKATDSKLGIRHLILESPEPKNDGRVQKDFPAGIYKFSGTAVGGSALQGEATLTHSLPTPTSFIRPGSDAKNVPVKAMKITWSAVKNLAATVVVIEQEKSGRELRVNLAGDATSLAVPDGFLIPGTEYKLAIGTVSSDGNASFIETAFTTSGQGRNSGKASAASSNAKGAKAISQDDAKLVATKAVPGKAIDVAIEKKSGVNRYVVEVAPTAGGKEVDVVIDMTSGKVLAVEK